MQAFIFSAIPLHLLRNISLKRDPVLQIFPAISTALYNKIMNSSGTTFSPAFNFQGSKPLQQPSYTTTGTLKTFFDDDVPYSFQREAIAMTALPATTPRISAPRQPTSNASIPDVDHLSNVSDHSTQLLSHSQNQSFLSPLLWYPSISQFPPEHTSFEKVRAEIVEILSPMSENESSGAHQRRNLEGTIAEPKSYYKHIDDTAANFVSFPNYPNISNVEVASSNSHFIAENNVLNRSVPLQHPPSSHHNSATHNDIGNIFSAKTQIGARGVSKKRTSSTSSSTCSICGKTYTESSNLSKHFRTVHLKLRPFRCNICPSSFAEKNKLGKHIQSVHEHARPFKCDLCNATFSQASDRKRHRLVLHEGCRPYICNVCGKAFGRRSSLTQHSQRVHKMLGVAHGISTHPKLGAGEVPCDERFSSQGFRGTDSINSKESPVLIQPLETPLVLPTVQPLSRMTHLMLPVSTSGENNSIQWMKGKNESTELCYFFSSAYQSVGRATSNSLVDSSYVQLLLIKDSMNSEHMAKMLSYLDFILPCHFMQNKCDWKMVQSRASRTFWNLQR